MPNDPRDEIILSLSEKLFICSRLLTCAAQRLNWDAKEVRELVERISPDGRVAPPSPPPDLFAG